MRIPKYYQQLFGLTVAMATCLLSVETCLAKKGGNGGGNPGGGGDPPSYPVQYSITKVNTPFGSIYGDHNNDAAVVGWGFLDETDGRRAMAYLPQVSPTDAFLIEDLVPITDIPFGWHSRSTAGINNHGAIVGNLERFGGGDARLPFLIRDAYAAQPQLESLGPFDSSANETALRVNDSGDVVIWSDSPVSNLVSLFVGNYSAPASSYVRIDFESAGLTNPTVTRDGPLRLSDSQGGAAATLVGEVLDGDSKYLFRVSTDGSGLELLPLGVPLFTDGFGEHSADGAVWSDVNLNGDMVITARVDPLEKGKVKSTRYAALWFDDTVEVVPAIGDNPYQVEGRLGATNSDSDFVIGNGYFTTLWHGDWSATNGSVAIAVLIDPTDTNKSLFVSAREMTDRNGTGWPTLFNTGDHLLILEPVLTSTAVASAAVPEPSAVLLTMMALISLVASARSSRRW